MATLIQKRLEEAKKTLDRKTVLGTLPTHSEYMLHCGESRGLQMALDILEEIYNHGDKNDNRNYDD